VREVVKKPYSCGQSIKPAKCVRHQQELFFAQALLVNNETGNIFAFTNWTPMLKYDV
jgi:hypothetical protein